MGEVTHEPRDAAHDVLSLKTRQVVVPAGSSRLAAMRERAFDDVQDLGITEHSGTCTKPFGVVSHVGVLAKNELLVVLFVVQFIVPEELDGAPIAGDQVVN